jgi:hypothetical protein
MRRNLKRLKRRKRLDDLWMEIGKGHFRAIK